MKTTGIHIRNVIEIRLEPGEWVLDNGQAVVRIQAAWYGKQGWESSPDTWVVGTKKDGCWSKAERNAGYDPSRILPSFVTDALESALLLIGETALGFDTAERWAHPDLLRGFYVR
jgi:hypothetical protein